MSRSPNFSIRLRTLVRHATVLVALGFVARDAGPMVDVARSAETARIATLLPMGLDPAPARDSELLHPISPCYVWAPPPRYQVLMQVTAYCPCPICCGPAACGLTASGNYIDYNRGLFVAADPMLPFGTKLIVPGYASDVVQVIDRGGVIHGNRLDVFFATHQQALSWGRKMLPVTIVNE